MLQTVKKVRVHFWDRVELTLLADLLDSIKPEVEFTYEISKPHGNGAWIMLTMDDAHEKMMALTQILRRLRMDDFEIHTNLEVKSFRLPTSYYAAAKYPMPAVPPAPAPEEADEFDPVWIMINKSRLSDKFWERFL